MPTASFPTTTTTRATCRILSNIARNLSVEPVFGQVWIPQKSSLLLPEPWLLLTKESWKGSQLEKVWLWRHSGIRAAKFSERQESHAGKCDECNALRVVFGSRHGSDRWIGKRIIIVRFDALNRFCLFDLRANHPRVRAEYRIQMTLGKP